MHLYLAMAEYIDGDVRKTEAGVVLSRSEEEAVGVVTKDCRTREPGAIDLVVRAKQLTDDFVLSAADSIRRSRP